MVIKLNNHTETYENAKLNYAEVVKMKNLHQNKLKMLGQRCKML